MKKLCFLFVLFNVIFGLTSCTRVYGNNRSYTEYMTFSEKNGKISGTTDYYNIEIDLKNETIKEGYTDTTHNNNVVAKGKTFPRYSNDFKEGYEGLKDIIYGLAIKPDEPYLDYQAVEINGTVYGYCNVFSQSVGYLSGGGNIGVEYITQAYYFRYQKETNKFEALAILENSCIIAFGEENLLYYKDKAYYINSIALDNEEKICDDAAYDSGLSNYSYTLFYFDINYALLFLHADRNNKTKDYYYFVNLTTRDVYSLNYLGEIEFTPSQEI